MLQYLTHKRPRFMVTDIAESLEQMEDVLVSDVIGSMVYLPGRLLLGPFLGEIARLNPHVRGFERVLTDVSNGNAEVTFWPHYRRPPESQADQHIIEPDAVISCSSGPVVFTEGKFRSPLLAAQLIREFEIGCSTFGLDRFYLLVLTADLVPPRVGPAREPVPTLVASRLSRTLGADHATVAGHVLWANWQCASRVTTALAAHIDTQDIPSDFKGPVLKLTRDLGQALLVRELGEFQILRYQEIIARRPEVRCIPWRARDGVSSSAPHTSTRAHWKRNV